MPAACGPSVYLDQLDLLVSVTSRPQQQAVLARVTQEAKERWDTAPRSASPGQFVSSHVVKVAASLAAADANGMIQGAVDLSFALSDGEQCLSLTRFPCLPVLALALMGCNDKPPCMQDDSPFPALRLSCWRNHHLGGIIVCGNKQ